MRVGILPKIFPGGKLRDDNRFYLLNPNRNDTNLGSFSVDLTTGQWADFAVRRKQGAEGSDLIALCSYYFGVEPHVAAAALDKMLGIGLFDYSEVSPEVQQLSGAELKQAQKISKANKPQPTDDRHGPSFPAPADAPEPHKSKSETGRWVYLNTQGLPVMWVVRKHTQGRKVFTPFSYRTLKTNDKIWSWITRDPDSPLPLYHLDQLIVRPTSPVLVVEGEKTAEAASKLFPDYTSTTSPHGSQSAHKVDWSPLKGRVVVIWPDRDATGLNYADDVAALALAAGATSVRIADVESS